jgi:hypothetical protein
MKNLLDHFPKQHHKPFGIVTASPVGLVASGFTTTASVNTFFVWYRISLYVDRTAVDKKFDEQGNLLDSNFEKSVHNFITELLWLAEKIVKEKAVV